MGGVLRLLLLVRSVKADASPLAILGVRCPAAPCPARRSTHTWRLTVHVEPGTKSGRDAQPWLQHITPLHLASPSACPPPCSFPLYPTPLHPPKTQQQAKDKPCRRLRVARHRPRAGQPLPSLVGEGMRANIRLCTRQQNRAAWKTCKKRQRTTQTAWPSRDIWG